MTKLDDLKSDIAAIQNSKRPGVAYSISMKDINTLIQIAEAAFEMPEPTRYGRIIGCSACGSEVIAWKGESGLISHHPKCAWQRIESLKKELESGSD